MGDLDVSAKSTVTDLVTHVDRAVERWLLAELVRLRPADAVLGEETGTRAGNSPVRWVLDPIDGTVNFVLGLPQYAVSVAAEIDGAVVAGAVINVASGELFRAVHGEGAFRDGDDERAVVATGFGYDSGMRAAQAAVAARLLPLVGDIRRWGSAALDLCFLAAGRLDAYFEAGLNRWDYAAGGLIAREAGCLTSGLRGRPGGSQLFAATRPELAPDFFALLEDLGADRVRPAD
jgi:myo-inositol-1(or 4)-monophosphatase